MIIVTADHGEGFRERKFFQHSYSLNSELINVPLIIKYPHQSIQVNITPRARSIDIYPTILDVSKIDNPQGLEGESLERSYAKENRIVFSEQLRDYNSLGNTGDKKSYVGYSQAIIYGRYKYIVERDDKEYLYDTVTDPTEMDNHIDTANLKYMRAIFKEFRDRINKTPIEDNKTSIDLETEEKLRSLGYLS